MKFLRFFSTKQHQLAAFVPQKIKNFCIVAHVDHGKSTLADRLLEFTQTISTSQNNKQVLDKLEIERERGITIKAQTATMFHNGFMLNLIDTPGHVDFSYEVTRSIACCETAILLVDAAQGIQAQTFTNFWLAFTRNMHIIPVLNKIDLPDIDKESIKEQIHTQFEIPLGEIMEISAKTGQGIDKLIERIVNHAPSPAAMRQSPLKMLLFDSWYDEYRGVIIMVNLKQGKVAPGDSIQSSHTAATYTVSECGIFNPEPLKTDALYAGQVGYIVAGIRQIKDICIGDTFFHPEQPISPMEGFQLMKPKVFAGFYPVAANEYQHLKDSISKLTLNDSSVVIEQISNEALGSGFQIGFLGGLHLDVFRQRLEVEFNADILVTTPTVKYLAVFEDGKTKEICTFQHYPSQSELKKLLRFEEPMVQCTLIFAKEHVGEVMNLCLSKRGRQLDFFSQLDSQRIMHKYQLPLAEVVSDFYSSLQRITSGFCSVEYEDAGFGELELVTLAITMNKVTISEFNSLVPKAEARRIGKLLIQRIKALMQRQQFEIDIRAVTNGKIIASERLSAWRKDVTGKCYGGDQSRKQKLLQQQREGKRRMKEYGNIHVPHSLFISVIKASFGL